MPTPQPITPMGAHMSSTTWALGKKMIVVPVGNLPLKLYESFSRREEKALGLLVIDAGKRRATVLTESQGPYCRLWCGAGTFSKCICDGCYDWVGWHRMAEETNQRKWVTNGSSVNCALLSGLCSDLILGGHSKCDGITAVILSTDSFFFFF